MANAGADKALDTQVGLTEIADFGSNPGALRMLVHLPEGLPPGAPLVVVLHGCTQSAADFDRAVGWSDLAPQFGFALLLPEQREMVAAAAQIGNEVETLYTNGPAGGGWPAGAGRPAPEGHLRVRQPAPRGVHLARDRGTDRGHARRRRQRPLVRGARAGGPGAKP